MKSGSKSFPLCEYINIDLLKTNVELIPWDNDSIRMEYQNDVPLTAEIGDNSLNISESSEFVISLFAEKSSERYMKLYLPREYYRDILIYTVSGSVELVAQQLHHGKREHRARFLPGDSRQQHPFALRQR